MVRSSHKPSARCSGGSSDPFFSLHLSARNPACPEPRRESSRRSACLRFVPASSSAHFAPKIGLSRRPSAQIGPSGCPLSAVNRQPRSSFQSPAAAAPCPTLFCNSPHQYHSTRLTLPLFSYSYALFCTGQNAISNPFCALRTLCGKHPGWRTPPFFLRRSAHSAFMRHPLPLSCSSPLAEAVRLL
jgi:hypothetical protein